MRTLIIPDIHLKHKIAEKIIQAEPHDELILLGDYFDDFGDTPELNLATAQWLARKLEDPKTVALFGNHDIPYRFKNERLWCPGFTVEKDRVINSILKDEWKKLKLAHRSQGYLFSHAGFHPNMIHGRDPILRAEECLDILFAGGMDRLAGMGKDRGGSQIIAGVTWMDWNSFVPISGIKQIVGHTPAVIPRCKEGNYCIDTVLWHHGIIEDGMFRTVAR